MKFFYISVRVFDFFVLLFIIYALRLLEKNFLPIIYTYATRSVQRRKAAWTLGLRRLTPRKAAPRLGFDKPQKMWYNCLASRGWLAGRLTPMVDRPRKMWYNVIVAREAASQAVMTCRTLTRGYCTAVRHEQSASYGTTRQGSPLPNVGKRQADFKMLSTDIDTMRHPIGSGNPWEAGLRGRKEKRADASKVKSPFVPIQAVTLVASRKVITLSNTWKTWYRDASPCITSNARRSACVRSGDNATKK